MVPHDWDRQRQIVLYFEVWNKCLPGWSSLVQRQWHPSGSCVWCLLHGVCNLKMSVERVGDYSRLLYIGVCRAPSAGPHCWWKLERSVWRTWFTAVQYMNCIFGQNVPKKVTKSKRITLWELFFVVRLVLSSTGMHTHTPHFFQVNRPSIKLLLLVVFLLINGRTTKVVNDHSNNGV